MKIRLFFMLFLHTDSALCASLFYMTNSRFKELSPLNQLEVIFEQEAVALHSPKNFLKYLYPCLQIFKKKYPKNHDLDVSLDDYENSLLHNAVQWSMTHTVNHLLHFGSNPNKENGSHRTPLYLATTKQFHSQENSTIISLLLGYGAHTNTKNIFGDTLLDQVICEHLAKNKGTEDKHLVRKCEILVRFGAQPLRYSVDNLTAKNCHQLATLFFSNGLGCENLAIQELKKNHELKIQKKLNKERLIKKELYKNIKSQRALLHRMLHSDKITKEEHQASIRELAVPSNLPSITEVPRQTDV